jgi:hypothetical protein
MKEIIAIAAVVIALCSFGMWAENWERKQKLNQVTQTNYVTITNWVTLVEDSNPTFNIKPGDVYTSLSSNNIWKAEVIKIQGGWVEFTTNSGKETYMMRTEMFLKLYAKEIN